MHLGSMSMIQNGQFCVHHTGLCRTADAALQITAGTRAQATRAAVAVRHGCRGSQATRPPALPLPAACR